MKKVKNGWVIKNDAGDYLLNADDDDFGNMLDAHIFTLKKDAKENSDDAVGGEDREETLVKIRKTIETL